MMASSSRVSVAAAPCRMLGSPRDRATWDARAASIAASTGPIFSAVRWWSSRGADPGRASVAGRASASPTPARGRPDRSGSGSAMTRTSPVAEPAAGSAADADTLRALEFGAIVDQLAGNASFEPSRELALATDPVADDTHVSLLQDQTDEADRLLTDQAQASIGGARDIRAALERAARGGRLTPAELL